MPGNQPVASPASFAVMPSIAASGRLSWVRGALGAALGVMIAGLLTRWALGNTSQLPWIVAPVAASAMLVFAFPASPLAQPWPVAGGSLISLLVGLAIHDLVPDPLIAATLAVAAAIGAMTAARCLHPPGGACALLGALGSPGIAAQGWAFIAIPLAANIAVLVAAGLAFNNLTGHRYPHHPKPGPKLIPETWAGNYSDEDLDAVLAEWDEVLDISREDLDALFRQVEARVQRKWLDDHK